MADFASPKDRDFFGAIVVDPPILLNRLLQKILCWNRPDLIDEVHKQWNLHFPPMTRGGRVFPNVWGLARTLHEAESARGPIPRVGSTLDRGAWNWEIAVQHHPRPVDFVPVHRWSAVSFIEGYVGHSYTGIVRVKMEGHSLPYKIFLFPTQPSKGRSGHYPTREHAVPAKTAQAKVYGQPSPPIEVEGIPSHTQLAEMIIEKPKYDEAEQSKGDFIGFSVIKGDRGKFPNRYSFTSFSSNKAAFKPGTMTDLGLPTPGGGSVPPEWGQCIRRSVDELLRLETDLLTRYGSKDRGIASLDKASWQRTIQCYWG